MIGKNRLHLERRSYLKTVILCGGFGTRLSEETHIKPKPMVEIGGMPILWHIMKLYNRFGYREFLLALGYKGEVVKNFFLNYHPFTSEITIHLASGKTVFSGANAEDWTVHLIDTGLSSMTGGRLYRLRDRLMGDTFMLTYGDGVSDVDLNDLMRFHRSHGRIATVTAVRPTARFGGMQFDGDRVIEFKEKPQTGEGWINGGFFVFEPGIFDYLREGDQAILEQQPLSTLAKDGQMLAYKHSGFWQCMDTLRDKNYLEELWSSGQAPWKWWNEGPN